MAAQHRTVIVEEPARSLFGKILAVVLAMGSGFYLMNFTIGIFEIPDMLPLVGNIDEAAMAWLFFSSLSYLGYNVIPNANRGMNFESKQVKPGERVDL